MKTADRPIVTVTIPSYNHSAYIDQCINSVITQTYPRVELIIIDDGSSDDSVRRVESLAPHCRDRFERFAFVARENRGLCNTLNEALAWARGDYFVAADSDDVLLPGHVATLVEVLESEPGINGVYGGAVLIDERGRTLRNRLPKRRDYSFIEILSRDKEMVSSGGMLRTAALRSVGGYLDGLYIEDWYIMLKLTEAGLRLRTIPIPVVRYRMHSSNISKNVEKMLNARLFILKLFSAHPGHAEREALVRVEAALDIWRHSRVTSLRHLCAAASTHAPIVAHPLFRSAVGRILTPTAIIDMLKRHTRNAPLSDAGE